MKKLAKLARKLLCWLRGHRYIPAYRQRTVVERFKRFTQVQYDCECCGQPTRWMRNYQHNIFQRNAQVGWEFASDRD